MHSIKRTSTELNLTPYPIRSKTVDKMNEMARLEAWALSHMGRISHFEINLNRRCFEDQYGVRIMPLTPEVMAIPEDVLVKQLNQQIGA